MCVRDCFEPGKHATRERDVDAIDRLVESHGVDFNDAPGPARELLVCVVLLLWRRRRNGTAVLDHGVDPRLDCFVRVVERLVELGVAGNARGSRGAPRGKPALARAPIDALSARKK